MTTTASVSTNPMTQLYSRLSTEIGVSRNFIRDKILPEWWDDRIAANPAGYAEAIGYISRRLALDLHSLQPDRKIQRLTGEQPKFKHNVNLRSDQVSVAQTIATYAAELACFTAVNAYRKLPESAQVIRQEILNSGADWVDLNGFLDYCWQHGVPVVPVTQFLNGVQKMDGLAAQINGRPAIVLSKAHKHSSWLLFILAHELGHIVRGHLKSSAVLVDAKVYPDSKDKEEEEANRFASALLTGDPVIRYTAAKYLRAEELAQAARKRGKEDQVYPGVIALNYAWNRRFFAVGNATLNLLEPKTNPIELMRQKMCANIDLDRLSEETSAYLVRMTEPA